MVSPNNPGYLQRIEEGERVGNFFTWRYAGVSDDGNWLVYNKNNEVIPVGEAKEDDKAITGNGLPKFTASTTHSFKWKIWMHPSRCVAHSASSSSMCTNFTSGCNPCRAT